MTTFLKAANWAIFASLCLGLASTASAAENFVEKNDSAIQQRILQALKKGRDDLQYRKPKPSPIAGLYEVQVIGGPVLYVTEKGDFMIAGDLFSIAADGFVNIQEKAREKDRALAISQVKKEDQIVFPATGETKAVVHVFTDVDCGYCQKLHNEMAQINAKGIEVRYLAYPRAGPNSESAKKLMTAWCAKDKQKTLTRLKNREAVPVEVCENNPVAAQYQLGAMVGVTGTPNIVKTNGEMIGGYVPVESLAEMLGI